MSKSAEKSANRRGSQTLRILGAAVVLATWGPSVGCGRTEDTPSQSANASDLTPAYLKAHNAQAGDLFGVSLALSSDGSTLAVGAIREAGSASAGEGAEDGLPDSGAVYVFTHDGSTFWQSDYLKASNPGEGDGFGSRIALSGDGSTLAVSSPFEQSGATGADGDQTDDSLPNAGAVYVFERDGGSWLQQGYLKATTSQSGAFFGSSLSLSQDGDILAVGAEGENDSAGAAYLFIRQESVWSQQAVFRAEYPDPRDFFGGAVALSANGNRLAVGAYWEDGGGSGLDGDPADNSVPFSGAVFLFDKQGTTWEQQAYLKPLPNSGQGVGFGTSLSFSADGMVLAVSAPGDASGVGDDPLDVSLPYSGAAYVFSQSEGSWLKSAYLKANNPGELDELGYKLSLSADGRTLAVGAALEGSSLSGINGSPPNELAAESGAVYVFGRKQDAWEQRVFVKAFNTDSGDRFGWSLGLSADAGLLAVGASREASAARGIDGDLTDNSAPRAGAAYVYPKILDYASEP